MEVAVNKRTQSRCREWERARRNKFNDAINKLGEIVKTIQKSNNPEEDCEDVQYPKIEIIQKAIIYLNNFVQEKTQWKAEILALQVELDSEKLKKPQRKDATTQVCSPENTIVVLPAAPYIFPQRPLLFPSVPPAIVLIDQNLQTLNKATVPIVNRNNGDITKTTMVNILPISAYSRPLSATKNKKHNVKLKNDINKKVTKKIKPVGAVKDAKTAEMKDNTAVSKESKTTESPNENKNIDKLVLSPDKNIENSKMTDQPGKESNIQKEVNINIVKPDSKTNAPDKINSKTGDHGMPNDVEKPKSTETVAKEMPAHIVASTSTTTLTNTNNVPNTNETDKPNKILDEKEIVTESKESSKLPNILPLDTTLCDNVVDGGNARLELAEEFLATSPTAAFLMSFPLVSGNRADSPAEEHGHNTAQAITKDNNHKRTDIVPPPIPYFEKPSNSDIKVKPVANKNPETCNTANKQNEQQKCVSVVTKESSNMTSVTKSFNAVSMPSVTNENPFLNLSAPSIITTSCTLGDTSFGLDFDCNISKSMPSQSTGYVSSNNFFYKGDPFGKSAIYSTSSITSTHEFNGLGLYPCAMEKYTSKNKPEFSGVDDNLMKIGSSRLTYDIDLGWSHKGLDFVNCPTTTNTFNKDTILTTTATPYTSSYNPFNPDFHVPLVPNSNKKITRINLPHLLLIQSLVFTLNLLTYGLTTHPSIQTLICPNL
ncbi:hypothetical protein HF086_012724 [Spodoptera exigua]|uniref:BHLH domain-containing protein n=1 Tax=Spodoptera exigua TaxID=7107 RepID=A0A922SNI9_SPOEX|nr:hypothetical protein HF086_012724 [Spodoptera exigua]